MVKLLRTAVEQSAEDDGWALLLRVGQYIPNNSSFSSVNYGYKKPGGLTRASELFQVEMRNSGSQHLFHYV